MGLFDKFKNMVDPQFGEDDYGEYGLDDGSQDDGYYGETPAQPQTRPAAGGIGLNSQALELKVVRPDKFETVTQIADHLLNHRTVVLNLEATNKETARRMIDFLSGVAYSIDGQLKKVANNTFVITPDNVDVSQERQQAEAAKQAAASDDIYSSL